jgi:hypothetical protein
MALGFTRLIFAYPFSGIIQINGVSPERIIMKNRSDGKLYYTKNVDHLGTYTDIRHSDSRYFKEELYRTKKGTYFVKEDRGPMTFYSMQHGFSSWMGSYYFYELTEDQAKFWVEFCLGSEELYRIWNDIEES